MRRNVQGKGKLPTSDRASRHMICNILGHSTAYQFEVSRMLLLFSNVVLWAMAYVCLGCASIVHFLALDILNCRIFVPLLSLFHKSSLMSNELTKNLSFFL